MFRRLLFALLLLAATFNARALEYTDVYYIPEESGWGIFLVQSETFQFISFFIYGPDGKPTWYTAELESDGAGTYSGPLYATTGTYFAEPWDPARLTATVVGTASFTPSDLYHATLVYGLTGSPSVTKSIRRQTLIGYNMAGTFSGSASGTLTGCANPADNESALRLRYTVAVTQVGDDSLSMIFTMVDTAHVGMVCTISGSLTHLGRLYRSTDGQSSCTGTAAGVIGGTFPITIESLHPTGQGIEGRWLGSVAGGCTQAIRFAAVRL